MSDRPPELPGFGTIELVSELVIVQRPYLTPGGCDVIDALLQIAIRRQIARVTGWLDAEAPYTERDRRHTQLHSPERAYFHLGYLQALRRLLQIGEQYSQHSGSDRRFHDTRGRDWRRQ